MWAVSYLTGRLYNHPVSRTEYRARLQELLTNVWNVWNETQLLAEVNRIEKLIAGLSIPHMARRFSSPPLDTC